MFRQIQLALDFFSRTPPVVTPAPLVDTAPAVPPPPTGHDNWRHPQANRTIGLEQRTLAFCLQRSRRRSIGLIVSAQGLEVRAPHRVSLAEIDAAVRERAQWIARKLAEQHTLAESAAAARIHWRDGAVLPWMGGALQLQLAAVRPTCRLARLQQDAPDQPPVLHLPLAAPANADAIRRAAEQWFRQQARLHFSRRLDHFAALLDVRWQALTLSRATTRWGSAGSNGHICLNWHLMHLRPALIDYVVVHELAHLREMNHSSAFWAIVARVMPDHVALRRELRQVVLPSWQSGAS